MRSFILICFLIIAVRSQAQAPEEAMEGFRHIISMIEHDSVARLAQYISYPLHRRNPIPDIHTPVEFIAYYPTLIDTGLKRKLRTYDDSVVFEHSVGYGLVGGAFTGDIWIGYDADTIISINYESDAERLLADSLTRQIQRRIHPSVNNWISNRLVWRAKDIIVRVDDTDRGLRYVSWTGGHKIADKPDLVLYGGKEEGGTLNWEYIFNNGRWSYALHISEMGETEADLGLFLEVSYDGVRKSWMRMEAAK